jgi:hypothetical protein
MRIRFCKGDNSRDTLVCVRDDGTTTWSKLTSRFAYHDMAHYVIETTLGCRDAFYGLITQGWDIEKFTAVDPATGQRPELPAEAMQVEGLVTTFQSQSWNGAPNEEILALWEMSCASAGLPMPSIASDQVDVMRERLARMWRRWDALPAGETLEVEYT